MPVSTQGPRRRDARRSRQVILDAAEALFAQHGARRLRAAPRHSVAVERALRAAIVAGSAPAGDAGGLAASAPAGDAGGPAADRAGLRAAGGAAPRDDFDQLLISVVALCFFPFEHADTMLSAMGIDAAGAAFVSARKAHVADVLIRMIGA